MAPRTRLEFLRRFTLRFVNPLTRPFVGWLPGFGIVRYRGRRSGRDYRTPMAVFRQGDAFVVALTYGSRVEWVKNVIAAGGCELVTRGRTVRLVDPRLVVDPSRQLMPQPVRFFLGLMRVTEFMRLRIEPRGPADEQPGERTRSA